MWNLPKGYTGECVAKRDWIHASCSTVLCLIFVGGCATQFIQPPDILPAVCLLVCLSFLCDPEPWVVSFRRIFETGTPRNLDLAVEILLFWAKGLCLSTQGATSQDNLTPENCKIRNVLSMMCTDGKHTAHTESHACKQQCTEYLETFAGFKENIYCSSPSRPFGFFKKDMEV